MVQQAHDPPTSGDLHAVRRRAKLDQIRADPAARTVRSGGQSHLDPQPPLVVGSRAEYEQADRPTIPLGLRCDPHQNAPAPRLRAGGSRDDDPCDPRLGPRRSGRNLLGRGRRTRAYDHERRNRRGTTPNAAAFDTRRRRQYHDRTRSLQRDTPADAVDLGEHGRRIATFVAIVSWNIVWLAR